MVLFIIGMLNMLTQPFSGFVQTPFVLCRLFRKPEEKADIVKYDEVDHTGSSPTTTKSSPDDISSDVMQETPMTDMQVGNQSEGIKRWLTDESDNITPNTHMPVDTSSISYMASDVEEDHVQEGTGTEVRQVISFTMHKLFIGINLFSGLNNQEVNC